MRIGIDISMLVYQGSGVATYTYNFVKQLLLLDKENEYRLFYSSYRRPKNFIYLEEFKKLGGKIYSYHLPPRLLKYFWNKFHVIPVEWLIGKVDIFHSSDFLRPPLLKGTKGITTVHDLTWKIFPDFHTNEIVFAHEKKMQKTLKYRDIILADSQQTKDDIIKYYQPNNKIIVVPLGVDNRFLLKYDQLHVKTVLEKYQIKTPYVLYVGAIEPRKNIKLLVQAFSEFLKIYPKYYLVLAGRAGWKNEEVYKEIMELKLSEKIITTGYIDDEDLPLIYQGANLSVYPSSYEGYGLPPLESLAAGTQVVAFNSPSLPISKKGIVTKDKLLREMLIMIKKPIAGQTKIPTWQTNAKAFLTVIQNL
jgi:glycosyltransferase involved in cell wall biosynthesis